MADVKFVLGMKPLNKGWDAELHVILDGQQKVLLVTHDAIDRYAKQFDQWSKQLQHLRHLGNTPASG